MARAAPAMKVVADPCAESTRQTLTSTQPLHAGALSAEAVLRTQLPWIRQRVRKLFPPNLGREDIEQKVLLTVLRSLPGYRGNGSLRAWIDSITVRVGMKHALHARARASRELALCDDDVPDTGASPSPFDAYCVRRRVRGLLSCLSSEQESAVFLHHVVGFAVTEVASYQGVPTETARSRLRLAMQTLRRRARLHTRNQRKGESRRRGGTVSE